MSAAGAIAGMPRACFDLLMTMRGVAPAVTTAHILYALAAYVFMSLLLLALLLAFPLIARWRPNRLMG